MCMLGCLYNGKVNAYKPKLFKDEFRSKLDAYVIVFINF